MHPLVLDVTHAIHAQIRIPFAQQNRTHSDSHSLGVRIGRWEVDFAKIVEQSRDRDDIKCAKSTICTRTLWIIVIAMY